MHTAEAKSKPSNVLQRKSDTSFFQTEESRESFFGSEAQTEAPFFQAAAPSVQAKCDACEQEEKVQRKEEREEQSAPEIQPKLTIGAPDDPYEKQADAVADQVVQRLAQPATGIGSTSNAVQAGAENIKEEQIQEKPEQMEQSTALLQMKPVFESAAPQEDTIQRTCDACEEKEEIQKKEEQEEELQTPEVQPQLQADVPGEAPESKPDPVAEPVVQRVVQPAPAPPPVVSTTSNVHVQAVSEEKEQEKPEELDAQDESIRKKPIFDSDAPPDDPLQRKCEACAEEDPEPVQRKESDSTAEASPDLSQRLQSSRGGGSPLPSDTRTQMEGAMGADFSGVRVHTGSDAADMSQGIHAQAFTHGSDIYFNEGKYDPGSTDGQRLLAHELTHTVQQGEVKRKSLQPKTEQQEFSNQTLAVSTAGETVQRDALDTLGTVWDATGGRAVRAAGSLIDSGVELAGDLGDRAGSFILNQLDSLAPDLLRFLRSDIIGTIRERLIAVIDGHFGGLFSRIQADGLGNVLSDLLGTALNALTEEASSGCQALGQITQDVIDFIRKLTGPQIQALRSFVGESEGFLSSIWEEYGQPALAFIREHAGAAWDWIMQKANWLWDLTAPIRNTLSEIWEEVKNLLGIAWNSAGSVVTWIQEKATAAWEWVKGILGPYIRPLQIIGGILLLLSPVGPVIAIYYSAPYVWNAIRWIADNWGENMIIESRAYIESTIKPAIQNGIQFIQEQINIGLTWLSTQLSNLGTAFSGLMESLGVITFFETLKSVVNRIAQAIIRGINWAVDAIHQLLAMIIRGATSIWEFCEPIFTFAVKVGILLEVPFVLPVVISAWLWRLLPDCYKPAVINFILDLIIISVEAIPSFQLFGEWWPNARQSILDFLNRTRAQSDEEKINASNRVARMISEMDLSLIGNQIEAIRQSPNFFMGQMSEELMGMNLGEPLPGIERTTAPSGVTSIQGQEIQLPTNADAALLSQGTLRDEDVVVDPVQELELDPELLQLVTNSGESSIPFGEPSEEDITTEEIRNTIREGEVPDLENSSAEDASADTPTDNAEETAPRMTDDERLQYYIDQMEPQCNEMPGNAPQAGQSTEMVPEEAQVGPLTVGQRLQFVMAQMRKGISNWWECNKVAVITVSILAVVTLIILEILTGGAITAALPPLMTALTYIFAAWLIARMSEHLMQFLIKTWSGDIQGGARSFARAMAIGVVELVFNLIFKAGGILLKAVKRAAAAIARIVRSGARGVSSGARALGQGARQLGQGMRRTGRRMVAATARGLRRFGGRAGRYVVRQGRVVFQGLRRGFARGARTLRDLGQRLKRWFGFVFFSLDNLGVQLWLFGNFNPRRIPIARIRDIRRAFARTGQSLDEIVEALQTKFRNGQISMRDINWIINRARSASPEGRAILAQMARETTMPWRLFREAAEAVARGRAFRWGRFGARLRGISGEVVTELESRLGRLMSNGRRLHITGAQVPAGLGRRTIDFSVEFLQTRGRRLLAEVKAWNPQIWRNCMTAFQKRARGLALTRAEGAAARQIDNMLRQLQDGIVNGRSPVLVIPDNLSPQLRRQLNAFITQYHGRPVPIATIPNDEILRISRLLKSSLGI